jgi:hypothetical protein
MQSPELPEQLVKSSTHDGEPTGTQNVEDPTACAVPAVHYHVTEVRESVVQPTHGDIEGIMIRLAEQMPTSQCVFIVLCTVAAAAFQESPCVGPTSNYHLREGFVPAATIGQKSRLSPAGRHCGDHSLAITS